MGPLTATHERNHCLQVGIFLCGLDDPAGRFDVNSDRLFEQDMLLVNF